MLLADVRDVFAERKIDRLASAEIITALLEIEDRPWQESNHGKPLSPPQLARLLKPYGVEPRVVRLGERTQRGYWFDDLNDAFSRYLGPAQPKQAKHAAIHTHGDTSDRVKQGEHVTAPRSTLGPHQSRLVAGVSGRESLGAVPMSLEGLPRGADDSALVRTMEASFDLLGNRYRACGLDSATADAMALTAVKALAAATARVPGRNGKVEVGPGGGA